jgi:hypothetical protein
MGAGMLVEHGKDLIAEFLRLSRNCRDGPHVVVE